ncbi:MAG: DMT family transporter [Thiolinea sp.]
MPSLTDNLRGILYMIVGMACFTFGDAFVKLASEHIPSGQVMMALGLGCGTVFLIMLKLDKQPLLYKPFFERPVLLRNLGEVLAACCMFAALALIPLSTVTAIIQTAPLFLTLAAALFLGEKVGIHRLSAVVIGFIGVLIVIRPGLSGFDQYSLLALLAVVGMSMRDVGARMARSSISTLLLSFYSAVTLALTGLVIVLVMGEVKMPDITVMFYLLGLVLAASLGLVMVTQSVRIAEISVVSPFRYIRLLYGLGLGIVVFDETIDGYTILGSLVTILAGIYIWVRENKQQSKSS